MYNLIYNLIILCLTVCSQILFSGLMETGKLFFCRWTVRAASIKSIIDNYSVLQEVWDATLESRLDSEMRARVIGVSAQMKNFHNFFGLSLVVAIIVSFY